MKIQDVQLDRIQQTHETQARDHIDSQHVKDIADAIRAGNPIDPVTLFADGQTYWIGDGHHRINAAVQADSKKVTAHVHSGGKVAAIMHAAGANATHGLKRTNADKRRAVEMCLDALKQTGKTWKQADIARHCGVARATVAEVQAERGERERQPSREAQEQRQTMARKPKCQVDMSADKDLRAKTPQPAPADVTPESLAEAAPVQPIVTVPPVEHDPKLDEKPVKNGRETFPVKERKAIALLFGKLVRALDGTPLFEPCRPYLTEVAKLIERGG